MTERATREGQNLGNYRLLHLLGRGGFAEVYLAQHRRLNTQAAIKVLHTQLADEDIDDFQREAQTVAALLHSHIVRVLDFDVQGGIPFLVMDIVISYVKQIAEALQYAHDQKLIHRDVKPENMLIGRHSDLLLSDFGIATFTQSSRYQSTQEVVGTVAYMAPEQVQGKPRPASDQYALGIVVYEWLSGTRPFHGSFTEIATQQVLALPPALREKVPTISQEVEQVVLTALAKDPKQRFASVLAFATALEQASQTIQSPSIRLQPPTSSPALRDSSNTLPASIELARSAHQEHNVPPASGSSRSPASSIAAAQTTPSIPPKRPPGRGGFSRGRVVILVALALITIVGAVASFSFLTHGSVKE
jgi:serine/threonine protein kinase